VSFSVGKADQKLNYRRRAFFISLKLNIMTLKMGQDAVSMLLTHFSSSPNSRLREINPAEERGKIKGFARDRVRNKLEWSNLTTTTILSYCMYPRMARPDHIRPFHGLSNNTTP
jgi:hypothetical protein